MPGRWVVDPDPAYQTWIAHARPSFDAEKDMVLWFGKCERDGPPPSSLSTGNDNWQCNGPSGERVVFRQFPTPDQDPAGYMLILAIGK